tara:strand:+ start:824 stop:1492 length:669 start_codon:yes stop_codon:yes gene_type:complete
MKNILAKGGVEFLAVFLGIALSLWVDDYRESKELRERLSDDYQKIYKEVLSNIKNIDNIIESNNKIVESEKKLINILNGYEKYNFKEIIGLINKIDSKTFFGESTAYKASVSSGRFNTSDDYQLVRNVSRLYEHFFVRLDLNGNMLDKVVMNFSDNFSSNFNKARFNHANIDSVRLKKYFFSDDFHNALLNVYEMQNNYYLKRLSDTKSQLIAIKELLSNSE